MTPSKRLPRAFADRADLKTEDGKKPSAKREAVIAAALRLFVQYGYRKTSIDEIAEAAQVAKRTVYLHFPSKAEVLLAIFDRLMDHVRAQCAAAEAEGGPAVARLASLLGAYFGAHLEVLGDSAYRSELTEAFHEVAQTRLNDFQTEYETRVVEFLRRLRRQGDIGAPPPGLTEKQVVRVLLRGGAGAKQDPQAKGDPRVFRSQLRDLATVALAALKP